MLYLVLHSSYRRFNITRLINSFFMFHFTEHTRGWNPSVSKPKTLHSGSRQLLRLQRQTETQPVPALHLRPCERWVSGVAHLH